jgi:hypothetical protein
MEIRWMTALMVGVDTPMLRPRLDQVVNHTSYPPQNTDP